MPLHMNSVDVDIFNFETRLPIIEEKRPYFKKENWVNVLTVMRGNRLQKYFTKSIMRRTRIGSLNCKKFAHVRRT